MINDWIKDFEEVSAFPVPVRTLTGTPHHGSKANRTRPAPFLPSWDCCRKNTRRRKGNCASKFSWDKKQLYHPPKMKGRCADKHGKTVRSHLGGLFFALLACMVLALSFGCSPSLESEDLGVRVAAVKKLMDQALLGKIALEDEDSWVRKTAVEKLTDQVVLAKIAIEDEDIFVRACAIEKIVGQAVDGKIAVQNEDKGVRSISMLFTASDEIPDRFYRIASISPALEVLNNIDVENVVGRIISVAMSRSETDEQYTGGLSGTMPGEIFECSIKLEKLDQPVTHVWSTNFPTVTTSLVYQGADVKAEDILGPVFDRLPVELLTQFAMSAKYSMNIAIVEKLTDQSQLARIAVEGKEPVRLAAITKLMDQALLGKIALEDESFRVRKAAMEKLTDQVVLAKIAIEDVNSNNRHEAEMRLLRLKKK